VSRTAPAPLSNPVTQVDGQLLLHAGIVAATCHPGSVAATLTQSRAQLTVNTAVPTSMLPLGVAVSSDMSKVRHMSPDIAKNLLQQSGECLIIIVEM